MTQYKSLKSTIVLNLAIPMVLFFVIETSISYFVALHYVDKVYDRWLLNSAHSLIQEIKVSKQKIVVDLPETAMKIFKWDDVDKTYFKVISETGAILAGDNFVPEAPGTNQLWVKPVFFDAVIYGRPVRGVSIQVVNQHLKEKVFIHVAETLGKRQGMMIDILLADLVPQVVMALLMLYFLILAVKHGLKPLQRLTRDIALRSPQDLSLIPESKVFIEVKTLTDTINDLLAKLSLTLGAQQKFIANAAHQLRTPLAGLKLQVERARRETDLGSMEPALAQIQTSADRASHLVSQLLLLARSESGKGVYEFELIDLNQLVKEVCIEWAPKAMQKQQELSFEGLDKILWVNGNAVLLRELLANLLDNAIEYGREEGHITIRLAADQTVCLEVEDDGCGIPVAERAKVFERFYRVQDSFGDGCGLGMAIVKEIADLHKAKVELLDGKNCGICVRVEMSLADAG